MHAKIAYNKLTMDQPFHGLNYGSSFNGPVFPFFFIYQYYMVLCIWMINSFVILLVFLRVFLSTYGPWTGRRVFLTYAFGSLPVMIALYLLLKQKFHEILNY